jgi:hypothetical protein
VSGEGSAARDDRTGPSLRSPSLCETTAADEDARSVGKEAGKSSSSLRSRSG